MAEENIKAHTVYNPKELYEQLEEEATANHRSVSAQVVFILQERYKANKLTDTRAVYQTK